MRVPGRSDIVWVDFEPVQGHEQGGRRPAIVLSPANYNASTGLMIVCPITTKVKGYDFEVPISVGRIEGVVLANAVRSVSWRQRLFKIEEQSAPEILFKTLGLLDALLFTETYGR